MDDTQKWHAYTSREADPVDTAARLACSKASSWPGVGTKRAGGKILAPGLKMLRRMIPAWGLSTVSTTVETRLLQQCRQALALAPDGLSLYSTRGLFLAARDDSKAALECLDTVVDHAQDGQKRTIPGALFCLRQERYQGSHQGIRSRPRGVRQHRGPTSTRQCASLRGPRADWLGELAMKLDCSIQCL